MSEDFEKEVPVFTEQLPETVADKQRSYYAMKDAELVEHMRSRGLIPAYTEEGRIIRKECYVALRDADERAAVLEKRKRKVRVIFHNSSNDSAGNYVFASINDRNFQAPFETEVVIPEYMIDECIERAKTQVVVPVITKDHNGIYNTRYEVKNFPVYTYSKLGYVD